MNSIGATATAVFAAVVLLGSRRMALLGLVAGVLWLTQQQTVALAGFNLYAFRLLELAALARIVARGERLPAPPTSLDKLFVAVYCYTAAIYVFRSDETAYAYHIGTAVDAFLCYFAFRILVQTLEDYRWFLRSLSLMLLAYVPLVVYESLTYENLFSMIGGVELIRAGDAWLRDGRLRATGSFGHPSLMGSFGAVFLPLYVAAYFSGERRLFAAAGIVACLVIVWASNSGGPAGCVAASIVGWGLWPLRRQMRLLSIFAVMMLFALAAVMKAPIWYLLDRFSSLTGGGGFHRAALLDAAFQHLDHWWLMGMPILETSRWLPYTNTNTGAVDMTNHFLVFGITAGLGAILLLIAVLRAAFSALGRSLALARLSGPAKSEELLLWGLGVALAVHIFNWFSITYWDQLNVVWILHIACVGSLISRAPQTITGADIELKDGEVYGGA